MTAPIDHLAFIITTGLQSAELEQGMRQAGLFFTHIDSSGGVLHEPSVCLLTGFPGKRLPELMELVRQYCKPYHQFIPTHLNVHPHIAPLPMIETEMGGAVVFIIEIERFEQL